MVDGFYLVDEGLILLLLSILILLLLSILILVKAGEKGINRKNQKRINTLESVDAQENTNKIEMEIDGHLKSENI
jgi:hypothetical protein